MPRYAYKCSHSNHSYETVHSMSEKETDCPSCETKDVLTRIPGLVSKRVKKEAKVGDVVKQFIKDAKQGVKEEKEKMKKEEFKP